MSISFTTITARLKSEWPEQKQAMNTTCTWIHLWAGKERAPTSTPSNNIYSSLKRSALSFSPSKHNLSIQGHQRWPRWLRLVQFSTPTRQHLRARQHTRCCWKHRWIHWPGRIWMIWGFFTRHSTLKFESCYTVVSNVSKPFSHVRLQETHHGAESHGTFIRLLHRLWHLVAPLVSMASLILMADSCGAHKNRANNSKLPRQ